MSEGISSIKKILSNERIFLKFLEIILALLKSLDHIVEVRGKYSFAIDADRLRFLDTFFLYFVGILYAIIRLDTLLEIRIALGEYEIHTPQVSIRL
jgi:hypothetical protein